MPRLARQFRDADGRPIDVSGPGPQAVVGTGTPVKIVGTMGTTEEVAAMAKIEKTGTYRDEAGNFYVGKAGDALPAGWTYVGPLGAGGDDETVSATERRAEGAAPENRMEPAPENRAKGR